MIGLIVAGGVSGYLSVGLIVAAVCSRLLYTWSKPRRILDKYQSDRRSSYSYGGLTLAEAQIKLVTKRRIAVWNGALLGLFWPLTVVAGLAAVITWGVGKVVGTGLEWILTPSEAKAIERELS